MLIQTDRPNGDGSQSDWTPKTGSDHHLLVSDETVDLMNNNSNLVSKNDGDTDLFTFPDLDPAAISSIKAVEISGASFSNAGPLADVVGVSLIGGVVYEGDENPQANKVSLWKSIFVQNPDTGSDWTVSDLNNTEFGIRTNHA